MSWQAEDSPVSFPTNCPTVAARLCERGIVQQVIQCLGDLLVAIMLRVNRPAHAQFLDPMGVVGLIVRKRYDQGRLARTQCLHGRSDTTLMNDGRRSGKYHRVGCKLDDLDLCSLQSKTFLLWWPSGQQ